MNDYTFHSEYGHLSKAILEAAADVIAFWYHGEPNPLSEMERKNSPNRAERDGRVRCGLRAGVAYFSSAPHTATVPMPRDKKNPRPRHALSRPLQCAFGRLRRPLKKRGISRGNGTQVGQHRTTEGGILCSLGRINSYYSYGSIDPASVF